MRLHLLSLTKYTINVNSFIFNKFYLLRVHTWARCCLRSDTLYLTHDMTALNTCSSDLTFSSSLEIISTSWPTGSNRNSSLSITCNPFITSINGMCTLFDITITKSKAQFSHCIWSFQFNFYKFQIKCKYIVQQYFQFHASYNFLREYNWIYLGTYCTPLKNSIITNQMNRL